MIHHLTVSLNFSPWLAARTGYCMGLLLLMLLIQGCAGVNTGETVKSSTSASASASTSTESLGTSRDNQEATGHQKNATENQGRISVGSGYRKDLVEYIARLGFDTDRFYLSLQQQVARHRQFESVSEQYQQLQQRFLTLSEWQAARPDGAHSARQADFILAFWNNSIQEHRVSLTLSDRQIRQKKQSLQSMFMQMLRHEADYPGR